MAEALILTVDNGGTNTRVARGDEDITFIDAYETPRNYYEAIGQIGAAARFVLGDKRPDAVGISIAGKVEDGRIVQAGRLQEYGWLNCPFTNDVASELEISPDRIVLLNDCAAGANAERGTRQLNDDESGAFMVLSTGFGGALYTSKELIADEPGHHFLRLGAICGDLADGHIEGFISGSGIERNHGVRGEDIPHDDPLWGEIKDDFHDSMVFTLSRYEKEHGIRPRVIGFTGSVALGGPTMLQDLQLALISRMGEKAPKIEEAIYRDRSGLYGAAFAADELLRA